MLPLERTNGIDVYGIILTKRYYEEANMNVDDYAISMGVFVCEFGVCVLFFLFFSSGSSFLFYK